MCKSDLGLILFHWVKGIQIPSPDFNTLVNVHSSASTPTQYTDKLHFQHQCRDPEAILSWAKENEAPIQHTIVKTTGVTEAEHPF
jgi:hypothetical protein